MWEECVILDLAKRGINIRSMNAHSNTPDGVKLMRHLGFTEIVPKAPVPGLRDFIIEVERSDIPHNEVEGRIQEAARGKH